MVLFPKITAHNERAFQKISLIETLQFTLFLGFLRHQFILVFPEFSKLLNNPVLFSYLFINYVTDRLWCNAKELIPLGGEFVIDVRSIVDVNVDQLLRTFTEL